MKFLTAMISKFDAFALRLTPETSDNELARRANEFRHDTTEKRVYEAYDSVDTKATAILQHVSIMIAVSSFLFADAKQQLWKVAFAMELLLYICLALSCLRLLMNEPISRNQNKDVVAKECILDLTAKLTFFLSVVLIFTVIADGLTMFFKASVS